jgi:hypothetical protein
MELIGRHTECGVLDGLVEAVRAGESRAIVVCGDAGVGKTALLEYVAERASDCRVIRAVGVQSEMELPFAALHQVCAPVLDDLERLPVPQREALRIAFGMTVGPAPDRFLVGLAVLGLLADIAEQQPLVCCWTTSSGWIAPLLKCWVLSLGVWWPNRLGWSSRPGSPAAIWLVCRSSPSRDHHALRRRQKIRHRGHRRTQGVIGLTTSKRRQIYVLAI